MPSGRKDPCVREDATVPAEERLLACVQQALSATRTGEQARDTWRRTFGTYLSSVRALPTDAARMHAETDFLHQAISMLFRTAAPTPKGDSG